MGLLAATDEWLVAPGGGSYWLRHPAAVEPFVENWLELVVNLYLCLPYPLLEDARGASIGHGPTPLARRIADNLWSSVFDDARLSDGVKQASSSPGRQLLSGPGAHQTPFEWHFYVGKLTLIRHPFSASRIDECCNSRYSRKKLFLHHSSILPRGKGRLIRV